MPHLTLCLFCLRRPPATPIHQNQNLITFPLLIFPQNSNIAPLHKYQSIVTNRVRAACDLPLGLGEETRGRDERILSLR
jgi:hypothetical protein